MRLSISQKLGPFRLGGSMKLTWWNAIFIAMAAMCYYMIYIVILLFELLIMFYYYMFKWLFKGCRWCFRKIKALIQKFITFIKSKTAGQ